MVVPLNLRVKVNGQSKRQMEKFRSNLRRVEREMLDTPGKQVPDILLTGKLYAKRIAPIDTGALVNAIVSSYKGARKGHAQGVLESRTPNHPLKGRTVPYNVIMHKYPNQYKYSGEPQFMYVTRDYMKRISSDKAKGIITVLRDELGRFA